MVKVGVIASSTVDQKYSACIPWFFRFWQAQKSSMPGVVFAPLVVVVGHKLPQCAEAYRESCVLVPATVPAPFLAQNIRTYFAGISNFDIVITSDIDMFPLSPKVLDGAIRAVLKNRRNFVVARDVLPPGQFPICYSVAAKRSWEDLYGRESIDEVVQSIRLLFERRISRENYSGQHAGHGWFTDQEHLFELLTGAAEDDRLKIVGLTDKETGHRRLDRHSHNGALRWRLLAQVALGNFTDYHCHYPVEKNVFFNRTLLLCVHLSNLRRDFMRKVATKEYGA